MDLGTDGRWEPGNDTLPSGFYRVSGGGHRAWSHLHTVVALRVGITQHDEDHIFDKSLFCTFAEIAAWIEENVAVTP